MLKVGLEGRRKMYSLGLKGCLKKYKGWDLKPKIKFIFLELIWAFERAWRGYDSIDVTAMNTKFRHRMIILLNNLKKFHNFWRCPEGYDWSNVCERVILGDYYFSQEQVDVIIDTLIFHFQMCDEDFVEKELYGHKLNDSDNILSVKYYEQSHRAYEIIKQNQDIALDLFKEVYDELSAYEFK